MTRYFPQMQHFYAVWFSSKGYRLALVASGVFALLRLAAHGIFLSGYTTTLPDDLFIYVQAGSRFAERLPLYLSGPIERVEFFQYAPSYALFFSFLARLSPVVLTVGLTILHFLAYALLFSRCGHFFERLEMRTASRMLVWLLPVWLLFSVFWGELVFMNIYVFMALLATLLLEAVWSQNTALAVLWLSLILQTKPQWAFAAVVPLLLGQRRFFFKLVLSSLAAYTGFMLLVGWVGGFPYAFTQYGEYFNFLLTLSQRFPWRRPEAPFLGYNHSLIQLLVYSFGPSNLVFALASLLKLVLLLPLIAWIFRFWLKPGGSARPKDPVCFLELSFALYLAAFLWLDMVWELFLSVVVFAYLLSQEENRVARALDWLVFLPYALIDAWQLLAYAILGDSVMAAGGYVLVDPTIYVPWILVLNLLFYSQIIYRLWNFSMPVSLPAAQPAA